MMNTIANQPYPYKVGGSLAFDHPTYVERQADRDLLNALRAGKFCYVFNCRQMGKSSLRVRVMHQLQAEAMSCVSIDISSLGSDISQQQWYSGIITQLFLGFHLAGKVNLKHWLRERDRLSPVQKLSYFLEEVILVNCPGEKIYIFIDEIDKVLSLNFSLDDFFTLIRYCYNQRAENPQFERLVFALFGVATPSNLIRDKTQTPFNIGQPIELTGFTPAEISPLAAGFQTLADCPQAVLASVLDWTGGQPFLTQKLCQLLINSQPTIPAEQEASWVEKTARCAIIKHWESQDEPVHLKTIRDRLFRQEKKAGRLLGLYQQILQQASIEADDSPEQSELRLSGLVVKRDGQLVAYNRIYQEVFNRQWVAKELAKIRPYSEAIAAWTATDYQDESRLLRGQALQDALSWAADKSLDNIDYKFLSASQDANLATQKQANEILTQANRRARHRIRIGAAFLVFSLLGAIFSFFQLQEARLGIQLEQSSDEALRQFEFEALEGLVSAMRSGQQLQEIVDDGRPLQTYPTTSAILTLEQILDRIQEKNQLKGHQEAVNSVSLSPDGQLIASASSDKTAKLWGREKRDLMGHQDAVYSIAFSPDGKLVATASGDRTAKVWNLQGQVLATFNGHQGTVYSVSFSPDGQQLVTTSSDKTARLWSLQGKPLAVLRGHSRPIDDASFSPDGQFIVTASRDGTAKLWDTKGQLIKTFPQTSQGFYSIRFSPDGQRIAVAAKDGTVRIWDRQGQPLQTLKGHQELVNRVDFSADGKWIVTASGDGTARVWNLQGIEMAVLRGHQDLVYGVAVSRNGQRVITASNDKTIKVWDVQQKPEKGFSTANKRIASTSIAAEGQIIAIASEDGNISLWNARGQKLKPSLDLDAYPQSLSFSPDAQHLAIVTRSGTVQLWNWPGKPLAESLKPSVQAKAVSFSPDGRILAVATFDGQVELWDIQGTSPQLIKDFAAHKAPIYALSFSPDGQRIATASSDKMAKLWDLSGKLQAEFVGHQDWIIALSFSPDGRYLVTASSDKTAKLWNIQGRLLKTLNREYDLFPLTEVSVSPSYIATASRDGMIRLWDFQGNLLNQRREHHQDAIFALQFSRDSSQLISVARDGTVRIWAVQEALAHLNSLLAQGCQWLNDYLISRPHEQKKLSACP